MRVASAAFVALAVAACAGQPRRQVRTARTTSEPLRAIRIEGNQRLTDKQLVAGLALERARKRGRSLDPYVVEVDADRIRGRYLREGYLSIDVRSRIEREGDASTVVYTVEEGRRARTAVVVAGIPPGDPALTVAKVRARLPLADGDPFDYAVYDAAKAPLLDAALDAGYAHAKLDATVRAQRTDGVAIVELTYELGPRCTFGTVTVTGADGALAKAVRARVQFTRGDRYSARAITATQRALYQLNRFSTVLVQPATDDPTRSIIDVRIAVTEGARHERKLGLGFGMDPTAYEVRGRAGYMVVGWPFAMDTVTLEGRPAYAMLRDGSGYQPRIRAVARLERQDLGWTDGIGTIEAGYDYVAVEAYTSYGPRAQLGFTTPIITSKLRFHAGWQLQRLDFRALSPLVDPELAARLGLDESERIGSFTQTLALDLRDHPMRVRSGVYAELHASEGTRFAGGAFEYLELVPEVRGYLPLGPVVLAGRARAGGITGDVPATERLFSGGAASHRGFGERRLAPFVAGDVDGDFRVVPYGGAALVETGVEARVPLTTWRDVGIGGVVFLDGGDVGERREDLDLGNLHWAAGVGVRLHTIVGPIRADLGYRLNRTGPLEPEPGSRYAFHLSLGEAF